MGIKCHLNRITFSHPLVQYTPRGGGGGAVEQDQSEENREIEGEKRDHVTLRQIKIKACLKLCLKCLKVLLTFKMPV
jgi:hypothetical protein